jgi:hypothetical protein
LPTVTKAHVIFPDRADIAVDSKNQNHKSFPEATGLRVGEKSMVLKAKYKIEEKGFQASTETSKFAPPVQDISLLSLSTRVP